jgi:hypothetical protein
MDDTTVPCPLCGAPSARAEFEVAGCVSCGAQPRELAPGVLAVDVEAALGRWRAVERWRALGRAGVRVSICHGRSRDDVLLWSVDALSKTGSFERPFAAASFEHAVEIAEIEAKKRGWLGVGGGPK